MVCPVRNCHHKSNAGAGWHDSAMVITMSAKNNTPRVSAAESTIVVDACLC